MQFLPIRLTKKDAAQVLGLSADGLNKTMKKDPTFPKPYKTGATKQAHVWFDYADLVAWHNNQKQQTAA